MVQLLQDLQFSVFIAFILQHFLDGDDFSSLDYSGLQMGINTIFHLEFETWKTTPNVPLPMIFSPVKVKGLSW